MCCAGTSNNYKQHTAGADPQIEEGGGTHRVGFAAAMRLAQRAYFLLARITHSVVWGSGGMLPQENFQNLDHMRVLLRPSETTITTQNLWQLDCNSGDSSCGRFLEPLPFGISLCI